MLSNNYRKILIPILALAAATLACNQVTGSTPQPAATLQRLLYVCGTDPGGDVHPGRHCHTSPRRRPLFLFPNQQPFPLS